MSDEKQKEIINFAINEFAKAMKEAQSGRAPTSSYEKMKKLYDTISKAHQQRENDEINDEEMDRVVAEEFGKIKD